MKVHKISVKKLTCMAMLVALGVVMAEVMKIRIIPKVLELSFGFIPTAVCGMLFGVVPTVIMAVLADLIGALLFLGGECYFGYTLTAFMTGLFYGLFLHKPNCSVKRLMLCQMCVTVVCYAGLNTLWAYLMGFGRSTEYMLTRWIVNAVNYPVYTYVLYLLNKYRKPLERAIQ